MLRPSLLDRQLQSAGSQKQMQCQVLAATRRHHPAVQRETTQGHGAFCIPCARRACRETLLISPGRHMQVTDVGRAKTFCMVQALPTGDKRLLRRVLAAWAGAVDRCRRAHWLRCARSVAQPLLKLVVGVSGRGMLQGTA